MNVGDLRAGTLVNVREVLVNVALWVRESSHELDKPREVEHRRGEGSKPFLERKWVLRRFLGAS